MTIIDMHPDDLLDRELAGTLSPGEQRRLIDHLAQCATCRLERQLRDDFSHELVTSRAPDMLQTFVSGALRAALPANGTAPASTSSLGTSSLGTSSLGTSLLGTKTPLGMQTPVVVPPRRSSRRRVTFLAVALVIASGAAAAQAGFVEQLAGFAREQLAKVAGEPAPAAAAAPRATAPHGATEAHGATARSPVADSDTAKSVQPVLQDGARMDSDDGVVEPSSPEPALDQGRPARTSQGKKARASKSKKARASERQRRTRRAPVAVDSNDERASAAVGEPSTALDLPDSDTLQPALGASSVPSSAEPSNNPPRSTRARSKAARARGANPSLAEAEPALQAPSGGPAPVRADAPVSDSEPALTSAAALFHHANSARREGLSSEALHSYERLRAEFPGSAEARLSLVLAARMHLDSGRLGDAVAGFDSYIATRDRSLREQALAGRAIALGRLGRAREEQAAWQSLLLDYPDSSYTAVASQRLQQGQR